jgi:hypothetical protein
MPSRISRGPAERIISAGSDVIRETSPIPESHPAKPKKEKEVIAASIVMVAQSLYLMVSCFVRHEV